jgi:lipopolysaccharide cholinephosphotransferase
MVENKCLQIKILTIYKEFKRICEKYNLRYFAIGGTCIGAIRHAGFIPWDDDMDVAMPYEDYEMFLKVAEHELNQPYYIFNVNQHKHSDFTFFKICDENTTFIEGEIKEYPDRYTGVYLDVMPLCGFPNSSIAQKLYIDSMLSCFRKNRALRFPLRYMKGNRAKIYWIVNSYKKLIYPYTCYTKKLDKKRQKYSFDTSNNIIFAWRRKRERIVFKYCDFAEYIEKPFEDTTIRVPIGYENYLRKDFGDYMKLPPEEERIAKHHAIVDLNKSYIEYKNIGLRK